ncbi:uncharacterized protein LOC141630193 [Silene latifolia]|uniref:uncharacterized protein LOC141630193 n=1 Tax=Silene latifolia TaxID=37657 RepID=UPI003D7881F6
MFSSPPHGESTPVEEDAFGAYSWLFTNPWYQRPPREHRVEEPPLGTPLEEEPIEVEPIEVEYPQMANDTRTIRELRARNYDTQPLCIAYPPMGANANFELKGYFIHNLPKFHGHAGDDPNRHLSEFHMMCEGAIPNGVTEDQFKLRAFPFSLQDAAKDCGDDLLVNFCDGLTVQYQIMVNSATGGGVDNYSVAEANEIIEKLAASTRNYGRSRVSKNINSIETPSPSSHKLEKTVDDLTKMVAQLVGNNQGGAQGSNVECNFCQGPHPMETCPIMEEQGISKENVSAMMHGQYNSRNPNGGGYYKYDPSGNTYNIGSRDNPNLSWGGDTSKSFQNGQFNHLKNSNSQGQNSNYQRNNNHQQAKGGSFQFGNQGQQGNFQGNHKNFQQGGGSSSQGNEDLSTNEMFKMIMKGQAENTKRFDKMDADKISSDARVKNLEIQLGQLAQEMAKNNQRNSNSIPSTTFPPKENASSMTLRKGRTLESPPKKKRKAKSHERVIDIEEQVEEELVVEKEKETPSRASGEEEKTPLRNDKEKSESNKTKDHVEEIEREYVVEVPFPSALTHSKSVARDEDLYETFRKCEVNIPLLNLLKGVPRYAKFLKELCTPRRSPRKGTQRVRVSEHVSAIFKKSLPKKCGDPGMFTIPCSIGDKSFTHAMLDLGASINVMPYALYETLGLPPLNKTDVVIQLADRSNIYPKGMVEDVLVEVDHLTFPADFYVLDMEADSRATPILLGRPFMKTSKTKIDVSNGNLTMEFDGRKLTYNIYDAMKQPSDSHSCYFLDIIEPITSQDYVNKLEEEVTLDDNQMEKIEDGIRGFQQTAKPTA